MSDALVSNTLSGSYTKEHVSVEDQQDIRASLGGNEEAYAQLVRRYQSDVTRQLWRFTRDQGQLEELVQEAFVEAYLSLPTFKGHAPFLHWLRRITTRVGYRYWRQRDQRREREVALEAWHDSSVSPHNATQAEAAEYVARTLALLPPRDRLVLTLLYLEECDTREIAERTGWSRAMVKVQAFRARKKLKVLLEKEGYTGDYHAG